MKRKLAIVTEIISPYRIPVFNALARRSEIDLHVIFLAETDQTQREWKVYKDEIQFSYQVLPSWRYRVGGYHFLLNRGMQSALTSFSPDAIVCGGYNYIASWETLVWARRNHVPLLLWVESTSQDKRHRRTLVESLKTWFMRRCQGFVVPGKSSFQYLRDYGIAAEAIFTAPNAVDNDFFAQSAKTVRENAAYHRQQLQLPPHFFLFAGRLVRAKGIFQLLEAYKSLIPEVRSQWGLVFVGSGEELTELQNRASSLAGGCIHFAGFAQREQLAEYYALADAFILPTHTDPWGLVVNEAMACGLPLIVSSAAGCVADLLREEWNGYTFSPGEPAQLAILMEKMTRNEKRRTEMGQHSSQHIRQYSPEICAAGIASAVLAQETTR